MSIDIRNNIINRMDQLIREIPGKIKNIQPAVFDIKPSANKWSKKEILGHLCDSAVNNLSRFLRAQFEAPPFEIVSYDQDKWVILNHYNEMTTDDVTGYWITLNRQIVRVIINIPADILAIECILGNAAFREDEAVKSLLWLIEDYLLHMEYHLRQIIGEDWLRNDYKVN